MTYRLVTKTQENNSEGYAPTTPPTLSPVLSAEKLYFKINRNTESGKRLTQFAQDTTQDAANKGDLNPIQGKDIYTQQCPPTPLSLPVDRLDTNAPIQSPEENPEERKEDDDNVFCSPT